MFEINANRKLVNKNQDGKNPKNPSSGSKEYCCLKSTQRRKRKVVGKKENQKIIRQQKKDQKKAADFEKTLAQMKKLDEKIKKNFRDFEHFKRILTFIFFSFSLNKILFSNQFFYGAYFLLTEKNSNL